MSAPLWMPGVQRLDCSARGLGLGFGNNTDAYHTWHTFEGIPANYNFSPMAGARYLSSTNKLAHFIFNPVLGGIVQLLRADQGARTLQAGPRGLPNAQMQTNARGRRHFQTEVLANAARPWTLDLTRAGLDDLTRLMNFLRAHGVVDQWAWRDVVRPAATYAEANRAGYRRMPDRSGHAFHSKWPWNTHWDPGAIAAPWGVIAPPATPGRDGNVFFEGADGPDVHAWQTDLAALGYDLVGVGLFGPKTTAATRAFQTDHGITVDGRVGPQTRTTMEDTMTNIATELAALRQHVTTRTTVTLREPTARMIGAEPGRKIPLEQAVDLILRSVSHAWVHARQAEAHAAGSEAALAALAGQTAGVDVEAVKKAARDGATEALAGRKFTGQVTLADLTDDQED